MRPDPAEEWQRLTKLYGEMSDGELLELAASYGDLTEIAQPILRDEMKKRELADPSTPAAHVPSPWQREESKEGDEDQPIEYTWKVVLCQCENLDDARKLRAALQQKGLDAWVEEPQLTRKFGIRFPEVVVAADQLEEARRIAALPIPQEVVDAWNAPPLEDFIAPACPRCRASESLLVSSEPTNQWQCDQCGAEWSDPVAADSSASEPVS